MATSTHRSLIGGRAAGGTGAADDFDEVAELSSEEEDLDEDVVDEEDEEEEETQRGSAAAGAGKTAGGQAESPRWKAPTMRSLLEDSDGDSDSDDGEAMLGRGTAGRLAGVLEGRTLGQALKATSAATTQKLGGRPLGAKPLGGGIGSVSAAGLGASALAPLKGGLAGGGSASLAPIAGGGAARRFS